MSEDPRVELEALTRRVEVLEALVLQLSRAQQPQTLMRPQATTIPQHPLAPRSWPVPEPDPDWIPILHVFARPELNAPEPCHRPGVYLTVAPQEGVNGRLEDMRILPPGEQQWREPQRGIDAPICSSCCAPIDPFSNTDLDYLSHMQPATAFRTKRDRQKTGRQTSQERLSPGSPSAPASLSFAEHTPDASADVLQDLDAIQQLAEESGMFNDRRIR